MYADLALYIDGRFLSGDGRVTEPVLNPASGKPLADLPHATSEDLDAAVAAAARAFPAWRRTAPRERGRLLSAAAQLMRDRADHIARVMTLEQGKPVAEARAEVLTAAEVFDWCAEEGRRAYGRVIPGSNPEVR